MLSRILAIANFFFPDQAGGQARVAYELTRAYVALGHEVWFLCQATDESAPPYRLEEGIHILRYFVKRSSRIDFARHIKHISAATETLDKFFPGYPDVVHGHDLLPYVAALERYHGRSRLCYTIHSPAIEELNIAWKAQGSVGTAKRWLGLPVIKRLERTALVSSDALEAKSAFTRSLVQKHYGNRIADQIRLIPGWVDTQRFRPLSSDEILAVRSQLDWPKNTPVLFTLRRLESRMGLDNYLRALALVRQRGHQVFAVIGGTGSWRDYLLRLCGQLQLSATVRFMGYVSDETLPFAYGACDASIIPTADLEGFGIIALEALACGKTTLVTPVGALPEVMRNFEPAWIAKDATPEGIADLIYAFLENKLPFHSSQELRGVIEQDYSYERALLAYERFLLH